MKTVDNYYLEEDYNCAETTIRLANDKYGLGLTEEDMKLLAGYGGGFCCGITCGALSSCVAVLAKMCVKTRAHDCPDLKPVVSGFVELFKETFGGTDCNEISPKYKTPERRCAAIVEQCQEIFDEYVEKLDI